MAENPTADSIQIEIEASSDKAISKLNALIDSLQKIKSASTWFTSSLKNVVTGINSLEKIKEIKNAETVARQLEALKRSANGFSNNVGDNLVLLAAGLKELSGISISKTAAENMTRISEALRNVHEKDAQRISAVAQSMTAISQAPSITSAINQLGKLPEVLERLQNADISGVAGKMRELADAMAPLAGRMKDIYAGFSSLHKNIQDFVKNYKAEQPKMPDIPDKPAEEQIEPEESLERKRSILQKIADLISKISGQKIDIGSAGGLKSLLGKDLSLQNLIPKGASAAFDALKNSVGGLTDKLMSFAAKHPAVAAALVALNVVLKTAVNWVKEFVGIVKSAALKAVDLLKTGVKKLTSALADMAKNGIKKAVFGLKSLAVAAGSRLVKPFASLVEKLSKWKQMLASALFYSTVFRAMSLLSTSVKEGIDNLYQYSKIIGTDFAPAMDKLATSALYLKNSIGAMAAPLIEAVAPAVDYLVDKFVELLNVIGKTFAALTGKDVYSQARKHAVEYAESAEEAKKETEKFKKFLLGIDELNIMPSQDEDDAEKKNPLEDYASMFEEVQVPVEQLDWAKQIREAIENGDWYSAGRILAEKLNEIVDGWDAYGWGRKLGSLITNGLNVAFGFLENFNFETIGGKLAGWINGIFDGINWDLLGRTFAEKWNALFDFIYGFSKSLNWTGIGLDIANAINGFIDQFDPEGAAAAINEFVLGIFRLINTAITETHWGELGEKLARFINEIDWAGIVYNGLMVIVNGLDAVKELVDAFFDKWEWETMADEISSGINAAFAKTDPKGWGETLGNLIYTAFQFAIRLISGIDWEKIGKDIAQFLIGLNWINLFSGLTGMISAGINAAISALGGFLAEIAPNVQTFAQELAQKFNEFVASINWKELGHVLSDGIKAAITFLVEFMKNIDWGVIGQAVIDLMKAIDWGGLFEGLANLMIEFFGAKIKLKILKYTALAEVGKSIVGHILSGLQESWKNITDFISDGIKGIGDAVSGVWNKLTGGGKKSASSIGGKRNSAVFSMAEPSAFSELRNMPAPKAYASGGFPSRGEMFIAREKGPELVGKIGQKTAVANNDQITSGIADGMRDANTDVVNAVYAMANMIVKAVEEKDTDINLDGQSLARGIQPYQNRLSSLQGASLIN